MCPSKDRKHQIQDKRNHKDDPLRDLKGGYNAPKKFQAKKSFSDFKAEWNEIYPKGNEETERDPGGFSFPQVSGEGLHLGNQVT